ncbi:MAG: hypothetical protein HOC71_17355, partial [Candidatus Latescibacteria bacterium]|nr:hypothetical protein [Candidatus Latescibacterota bacterium]
MNYPDASVEVSKNTLTPCPPLSHAKEGDISVHPGLGFPSLPGREGLGVSQDLMGVDYDFPPMQASRNSFGLKKGAHYAHFPL